MRFINILSSLTLITLALCLSATRIVTQHEFSTDANEFHQDGDTITLYLTFDDGIVNGSNNLISVIDSCYIPVTVFLIGKFAFKNDSTKLILRKEQTSPWFETANHSYSHANSRYIQYYSHLPEVLEDFKKNNDSLSFKNKLARLPGRNVWRLGNHSRDDLADSKTIADSLAAKGFKLIGWDLEWNYSATDLSLEPEDDFIFRIQQALRYKRTFKPQHLVILCHDPALENPLSVTRLISFIRKINKDGHYRFRFLSNYPDVNQ